MPEAAARRKAVRAELVRGGVADRRELADRLAGQGMEVDLDDLAADLRALGALRVAGPDGPTLALPVGRDGRPVSGGAASTRRATAGSSMPIERLRTEVVADPDWKLQLAVLGIVVVLALVGLLGWALGT